MLGNGLFRIGFAGIVAGLAASCAGEPPDRAGPRPATTGPLTGKLLVAAPRMPDPRFAKTVVLVVRHTDRGAMGLVVNRGVGRGPLASILKNVGIDSRGVRGDIDVHLGGPVRLGTAYVLHSPDYADKGTVRVTPHISMSATTKIMRDLGGGGGPKRAIFVLGHSGWKAGQLDAEIRQKYWVVVPAGEDLVFGAGDRTKWIRALIRRGVDL